ncbi:hypothetical protein BD410DRAFT_847175 [Rickenella mellea]|uniref:BAH domain-containing protein n=1 Tax=Rickenella mellea TaxID=50990 RepID=A0A4Y7PFU2_9AGAM|nr:hypothetical protein BD410DRAFT_847175 [Rickenella mellea]
MNDVGTLWVAEIKDIRANGKMHWIRVKWLYSEAHLLEVGATSMPTSGLATLELCKSDHCDWIDSRCIEDSIEVALLDFSSRQKWIEPGKFFHRHVFNATKGYLRKLERRQVFGAPNCCGTHNPDSQLLRLCANKHMSHDECLQRKQARLANNVPILSDPPPGVPSLLWNIAKSAMVSGVLNGVDYGVDGLLTARLRAAECLKSYLPGTGWEDCVGEKEVKYFEQNTHLTGIPIRYECPTEGCPYAL